MKIAFLDDHLLMAESLAEAVRQRFPDAEACCYGNWVALEADLNVKRFDVVFLDMRLEECLGAELIPYLKETSADTRIVIVSAFASRDLLIKCLNLGICGYISKTSPIGTLLDAITEILRGGSYFDEGLDLGPGDALPSGRPSGGT